MKRSTSYSTASNKLLLDTHVFIWWMEKSKHLSKNLYDVLNNPKNSIFLSVASIWEIVLKIKKGKLKTTQNLEAGIRSSGFIVLPIEALHALGIEALPNYHSDPFDRIIIAQAITENLILVTKDKMIRKYNIKTIS